MSGSIVHACECSTTSQWIVASRMQEYDATIRTTSNDGAGACYGARLISVRPSGSMREHSTMLASSYLLALAAHNVPSALTMPPLCRRLFGHLMLGTVAVTRRLR